MIVTGHLHRGVRARICIYIYGRIRHNILLTSYTAIPDRLVLGVLIPTNVCFGRLFGLSPTNQEFDDFETTQMPFPFFTSRNESIKNVHFRT